MDRLDPSDDLEDIEPVERTRVRRAGLPLRIAIAAAVAFLVIAVAKPWAPRDTAPSPDAEPAATLSAGQAPNGIAHGAPPSAASGDRDLALAANMLLCPDAAWLVVDDDLTVTSPTRTWTVAPAAAGAASPGDASIPFTRIVSRQVRDLGFCSPLAGKPESAEWTGTLWQRTATGWQAVANYHVASGRLSLLLAPAAAGGTRDSADAGSTWPPGQYVLQAYVTGADADTWLGIEIESGA